VWTKTWYCGCVAFVDDTTIEKFFKYINNLTTEISAFVRCIITNEKYKIIATESRRFHYYQYLGVGERLLQFCLILNLATAYFEIVVGNIFEFEEFQFFQIRHLKLPL